MNGKLNIEAFQDLLDSETEERGLLAAIIKLAEVENSEEFSPSARGGGGEPQPLGAWSGWHR